MVRTPRAPEGSVPVLIWQAAELFTKAPQLDCDGALPT